MGETQIILQSKANFRSTRDPYVPVRFKLNSRSRVELETQAQRKVEDCPCLTLRSRLDLKYEQRAGMYQTTRSETQRYTNRQRSVVYLQYACTLVYYKPAVCLHATTQSRTMPLRRNISEQYVCMWITTTSVFPALRNFFPTNLSAGVLRSCY